MTCCWPRLRMRWSGATDAIARCKSRSTGYARKRRSVPVLRSICGVKPRPKAVNKPSHHCIRHGLDKPGVFTTVSNNVGISVAGHDAAVEDITTEAFDRLVAVNLRGMVYSCKHTIPIMRQQRSGAIVNISSMAAWTTYPWVVYKTTKAAVIALTPQIAIQNAPYG